MATLETRDDAPTSLHVSTGVGFCGWKKKAVNDDDERHHTLQFMILSEKVWGPRPKVAASAAKTWATVTEVLVPLRGMAAERTIVLRIQGLDTIEGGSSGRGVTNGC